MSAALLDAMFRIADRFQNGDRGRYLRSEREQLLNHDLVIDEFDMGRNWAVLFVKQRDRLEFEQVVGIVVMRSGGFIGYYETKRCDCATCGIDGREVVPDAEEVLIAVGQSRETAPAVMLN